MTYDEYKTKLDAFINNHKFYSGECLWTNKSEFEEFVNEPNAKMYIHELLSTQPSWVLYSIVVRVYPDIVIQDHNVGKFRNVGIDMLNWIEEHA